MTALADILHPMLHKPVPAAVQAVADHVRTHMGDACAILAYGSALRDASPEETLVDLYVLTRSNAGTSASGLSRLACAIVPPNVYYAEARHLQHTVRTKYAVLSLPALEAKVQATVSNPYFWVRFAQPMRIVWTADTQVTARLEAMIATACGTAWANARGTTPGAAPAEQWIHLFQNTYRTELRPESGSRAAGIVDANRGYYEAISAALPGTSPVTPNWSLRRIAGRALSVLRLAKASFTFQGGADYIAWKVKRHSGVTIEVTEFQRRHPLIAGVLLLPKLLRSGAVR